MFSRQFHGLILQKLSILINFISGLKIYLKKLRLHKYCATFLKYTYDEFINLDDETLKRDGVTLGARGKIMKSLEKIHRRPERLQELLKTIEVGKLKVLKPNKGNFLEIMCKKNTLSCT